MSARQRWVTSASVCFVALFAVLVGMTPSGVAGQCVPPDVETMFELDENAVDNSVGWPDDWDTLLGYAPGGSGLDLIHSPYIEDPPPGQTADDIFTTGGAKDDLDVSSWLWTTGNVPDKDDIKHAYGALYRNSCGQLILVFGLDRYANNGDAQLGFWLFRDAVYPHPDGYFWNGTYDGLGNPVRARHKVGDLLILCHFTNGGATMTADVYEWMGADGPSGYLGPTPAAEHTRSNIWAVPNLATPSTLPVGCYDTGTCFPSPWPYTPKSGSANYFPDGSFFEGALNINAMVPGLNCFSSFMAETRSSQEVSAQLKDFALQTAPTCSCAVTKTGPELSKATDSVTYHFDLQNTGIGPLYLQSLSDDVLGNLASYAPASCSPVLPGQSCSFDVPYVVKESDPDPLVNTVTAVFNDQADLTGAVFTSTGSHSLNLFQPSVSVTKAGPTMAEAGTSVTYTFTITNTSSADSPNLVLDRVIDDVLGNLTTVATAAGCGSLAPGASCSFTADWTVQPAPNPLVNTIAIHYHPLGFPNDIAANATHTMSVYSPSVAVVKNGPERSKVGDPGTYTFTITNTSSANSPSLLLNGVTDNVIGNLTAAAQAAGCSTLAPGAACSFSASYTVKQGDPDPLVNIVTVHYQPVGSSTDVHASASHSTNLFQPSIKVEKSGPDLAQRGETITYTFKVTNTSSTDSPDLLLDSVSDNVLGSLTSVAQGSGCATLAPGAFCTFTKTYTIQPGDSNPLTNTVTVHYHPEGFPNDITHSASHTVNLFVPSVGVVKGGPALSKVGDPAVYTFTMTNTSSPGSPPLLLDGVSDNVIGNLTADAQTHGCATLAVGASCSFTKTYVVKAGDPDPLVNTVTVHYHPQGFASDVTASTGHSTNLFQPSVTVAKTGPTLAEVGVSVPYTFTLTNTSSADSPPLVLDSVVDDVLGNLTALAQSNGCTTLAPGATCTFTQSRVVQSGDPDPLINTVTVHLHPEGFPNDITASATHAVNLFNPALSIVKGGPALSKVGDPAMYTFTITNTGSPDSPPLVLDSVSDNVIGGLTAAAAANGCSPLDPGASCSFSATRIVQAGDPDPLVNTVTAHYHPLGFVHDLSASSTHATNLFQPSVAVAKTCDPYAIPDVSTVTYTFTITNTSSPDSPPLALANVTDSLLGDLTSLAAATCASLAPGASCTFTTTRPVLGTDPDPLVNTVSVLFHPLGFPNDITASATCSTDLIHPAGEIVKTCLNDPVPPGAAANFRINVYNTGDVPLIVHLQDPTLYIDQFITLGVNPSPPCSSLANDPSNGCFMVEAGITPTGDTVLNNATVDSTLDASYGIPGIVYSDSAGAICTVQQGGATRTQGFWATHCDYTQHVFNVHLGSTMNIGWKMLDGADDVFGIFWANNAKDSNNKKRNPLCQAREIAANQVVAAILNTALSNGAALPVPLETIQAIMAGSNIAAIQSLGAMLDAYNQSGDNQAILDTDGHLVQHADPKCAKDLANIPFADCP